MWRSTPEPATPRSPPTLRAGRCAFTCATTASGAPGPTGALSSVSRTGLPPSTAGSRSRARRAAGHASRPPSCSPERAPRRSLDSRIGRLAVGGAASEAPPLTFRPRKELDIRLTRAAVPAMLAVGLIIPAAATAAPTAHVRANASGSDAPPPVLPSIVRKRINRGEKALERAGDYVDREMPDKAVVSLRNARRNMYAAWRNAVDVVENAPPPPPAEAGRVHHIVPIRKHAHKSATYVGPEETAVAELNLQHNVAAARFAFVY